MQEKNKKILKEAYPTVALLCAIVIFLNFGFFKQQVTFFLSHYNNSQQTASTTGQLNVLQIPSLGLNLPIIYATEKTETIFQAALVNGVVHYPETANPGQPGNVYIFGHSSDFIWSKGKYKNAFSLLPKIQIGALIFITDQSGVLYTYKVTKIFIVAPTDLSVLDQFGNTKKMLTLQTSYPVGTALKRFVAQAEIVQ